MSHKGNKIRTLCQEGSLPGEQRSWALGARVVIYGRYGNSAAQLLGFWECVTSCGQSEQEGELPAHS